MSGYFGASGGSSPVVAGSQTGLSTPVLSTQTIAVADTEQSYALPAGTAYIAIQNMSTKAVRIAYAAGDVNGADYYTLPPKSRKVLPDLDSTGTYTLYFRSSLVGARLEIESWS